MNPHFKQQSAPAQILVVDDMPVNLKLLADILAHHGYRVRPAPNGRLALKSVAAEAPDLILLDVRMPDMDGYEVCRELKSAEHSRNIPVIFVSALDEVADKVKGFNLGGVDYITKPYQSAEVLARVETHLALRSLQKQLEAQNIQLQREIAEREKAEAQVRKSEAKYRHLFDNSPIGIFQATLEGRLLAVNQAFARMFGYDSPEDVVIMVKDIARQICRDSSYCKKMIDTALAQGGVVSLESDCLRKDGSAITGNVYFQVAACDDGSAICLEGFFDDITRRKHAEQEQEVLRNQLVQAQKMQAIGTLTGGVAHDFNNMLTIIIGYSELALGNTGEDDPRHADLEKIVQTAGNGADLVQRLLTLSKQKEMHVQRLDLNHRVSHIQRVLSKTLPGTVEISLKLAADLATIDADPEQMDQILMNLATNAGEAMPAGGQLTLETRNVMLDEESCRTLHGVKPGHYVLLRVSDTGGGMDRQTMDRMFEPFFTTKGWDSRKGTGLGLAIVQGVVQQHGGHIECSSEPGKGTTFNIYLPVLREETVTPGACGETVWFPDSRSQSL